MNIIRDWHNSYDMKAIGFQELPPRLRKLVDLKPYYIMSQGGCGTTYLRSFFEKYCEGDHMGYPHEFGGCCWNEHRRDPAVNINANLLFIYGNPCDATLSFFRRAFMEVPSHVTNIGGDTTGLLYGRPWTLERYLDNGIDFFQLESHLRGWLMFDQRQYNIMFVKYDALNDNILRILDWLDFPAEAAKHFAFRERASKWRSLSKTQMSQFKNMFGSYIDLQDSLPDVLIKEKN